MNRPGTGSVLVWDAPVRVFHWLLVLSFAGAWITAESETWRLAHVSLGYTVAGLVVFRLLWGLVGTRYARFGDFVRGPQAVWRYLKSLLTRRPEAHVGHNPAGAVVIVALLALALLSSALGWAAYEELGGEWLEEAHEASANLMLALVAVHLAGVVVSSWLHRENLVRSMITGRKPAMPADAIGRAWWPLAGLLLAAVLAFWLLQWQAAPEPGAGPAAKALATERDRHRGRERRHDDD